MYWTPPMLYIEVMEVDVYGVCGCWSLCPSS